MTCSVVDTISQSNIANILCAQDLWWKPRIQLARRELSIKPLSLKSTKSQKKKEKKKGNKPANRGKITNFHWNENKRTEQCLPLLQVVGDWKNNGSNHGSCRRWGSRRSWFFSFDHVSLSLSSHPIQELVICYFKVHMGYTSVFYLCF